MPGGFYPLASAANSDGATPLLFVARWNLLPGGVVFVRSPSGGEFASSDKARGGGGRNARRGSARAPPLGPWPARVMGVAVASSETKPPRPLVSFLGGLFEAMEPRARADAAANQCGENYEDGRAAM